MSEHHTHSQHSHVSRAVDVSPSLLRLSAMQRMAGAGFLSALLWALVYWAIT